jgi:hypothetical protein
MATTGAIQILQNSDEATLPGLTIEQQRGMQMKRNRRQMDSAAQHEKFKLVATTLDCGAAECTLDVGVSRIFAAGKHQEPHGTIGTDFIVDNAPS